MDRAATTQLLRRALTSIRRLHPNLRLDTVDELLAVGELRVALEILCDNLADTELAMSETLRDELSRAAESLGMDPRYTSSITIARASEDDGEHR